MRQSRPCTPGEYIHDGDALVVRADGASIRTWGWPVGASLDAAFMNCRDRADNWAKRHG